MIDWIAADWPAPGHVRAGTTTRLAGVSHPPFDGLNLAGHVGDRFDAVARNRLRLRERLKLPAEPVWLQQRHGNKVIQATQELHAPADGAYSNAVGKVCAVLSADCVPLLLCNRKGTEIAALHVGWRGLCRRIIKQGLSRFDAAPGDLLAWVGPHISQANYEVGADVISRCQEAGLLAGNGDGSKARPPARSGEYLPVPFCRAVSKSRAGHWFLDLGALVKNELLQLGVADVSASNHCTYANTRLFYSWRRDGVTGRMASLIWMAQEKYP